MTRYEVCRALSVDPAIPDGILADLVAERGSAEQQRLFAEDSWCRLFTFAGWSFPKKVWDLPYGTLAHRLERFKVGMRDSGQYHAPKPLSRHEDQSIGFYLDSDGAPGLRWEWCDEVRSEKRHNRLNHRGWFIDEDCHDIIRGVVWRLPHGRGFLAGWSMGEGMSTTMERAIYDDPVDCAHAADSIAEHVAEDERIYHEAQQGEEE